MIKFFRLIFVLFMVLGLGSMTLAQAPAEWTVDPHSFEFVMTITGILKVNNQPATESDNVIAAFVGGECRGVDTFSVFLNDRQMCFLMVYSNTNGETVTFKTYYSPLDTVLINTNTLVFDGTAPYGSPDNPYEIFATYPIVGVRPEKVPVEQTFYLCQNYPNPFNSSTTIRYKIDEPGIVKLAIYNLNGNEIDVLVNTFQSTGDYHVDWCSDNLSSGHYFYILTQNNRVLAKSCIYLK